MYSGVDMIFQYFVPKMHFNGIFCPNCKHLNDSFLCHWLCVCHCICHCLYNWLWPQRQVFVFFPNKVSSVCHNPKISVDGNATRVIASEMKTQHLVNENSTKTLCASQSLHNRVWLCQICFYRYICISEWPFLTLTDQCQFWLWEYLVKVTWETFSLAASHSQSPKGCLIVLINLD